MEKWLRSQVIHNDGGAKEMAAKCKEKGFDEESAKAYYDWARHIISNDQKALDLVFQFHDAGFTLDRAKDMYTWARRIIANDQKAIDLVLEFDQKHVPDDYVKTQYEWARRIISNDQKALDLVRKTHGHPFGPMPLWYTRDMYKFARGIISNDQKAIDQIFEWYGLVEIEGGDGWLIWWHLPSFEELAQDIPKFYAEIRRHTGNDDKALELTSRIIKIAGRVDLAEFKSLWTTTRHEISNDAGALEAVFAKLESRPPVSR